MGRVNHRASEPQSGVILHTHRLYRSGLNADAYRVVTLPEISQAATHCGVFGEIDAHGSHSLIQSFVVIARKLILLTKRPHPVSSLNDRLR